MTPTTRGSRAKPPLAALVAVLVPVVGVTSACSSSSSSASASRSASPTGSATLGPQSVEITSVRGSRPLRLDLNAPAGTVFRLRTTTGTDRPCSVMTEADGVDPPIAPGVPSARYTIECQAGTAGGAVLLPTTTIGDVTSGYEVPLSAGK